MLRIYFVAGYRQKEKQRFRRGLLKIPKRYVENSEEGCPKFWTFPAGIIRNSKRSSESSKREMIVTPYFSYGSLQFRAYPERF
jgi:hypothetical protein